MMIIKFKIGYENYIKGDIAGFKNELSTKLVKQGYADFIGNLDKQNGEVVQHIPSEDYNFKKEVPKLSELLCPICGKEYKTKKGVKNHLWKKHKIK